MITIYVTLLAYFALTSTGLSAACTCRLLDGHADSESNVHVCTDTVGKAADHHPVDHVGQPGAASVRAPCCDCLSMTLAALGRDLKSVIAQKTSIGTQESALGLTPSCGLTTAAGTSSKFLPDRKSVV